GSLVPGRDGQWFEFVIDLDSFPVLKVQRDSAGYGTGLWSRGNFSIVGNPSLANVRYMALGIENTGVTVVSGGIWFDDIRLSRPHKEPGYGFQARTGVNISDIASIGLNFSYLDPNFRRFSEGRGVQTGGFRTDLGITAHANLDRLLPHSWGISLPITYSRSQNQVIPKFAPLYPDLRVSQEQTNRNIQTGYSEDISLDNIRKQKSGNRLLNYTAEAMDLSWRRRRAGNQTPLTQDSSISDIVRWNYSINPESKIRLPRENELYPLPRNIRFGLTESRRLDLRGSRSTFTDTMRFYTTRSNDLSTDFTAEFSPIEDLSFDYGVETERDLRVAHPDSLWFLKVGTESGRNEDFNVSYDMDIGDVLSPSIDFDASFSSYRPKLDTAAYADYSNISNSGELTLNASFDLPELLDKLAPKVTGSDSVRRPGPEFRRSLALLSTIIQPLDVAWSTSRSSDYYGVVGKVPWNYRLGLTDTLTSDTLRLPTSRGRQLNNTLRVSSGLRIKELTARLGYDWSQVKDHEMLTATFDRRLTWPELDLSLGKVHTLFPALATDSRLSTTFRGRDELSGLLLSTSNGHETLGLFGRNRTSTKELNPLVSWQTSWKRRLTTNLSVNYSTTTETRFQSEDGQKRSIIDARGEGVNGSLSYTFSAPKGIKFPFLTKVRFSSDLSLTWQFRYQKTFRTATSWIAGVPTERDTLQLDYLRSTNLAASYRFSRSIEAGFNTGYSVTANGITTQANIRTDIDLWVLFKF
ncbi:MAG: hypothetical protein ABIK44_07480, partial [candidate division WOR-3 bacterium]